MKDLNFEKIGKKIKEVRLEKKLTQEYLADAVDVNTSHISNIENNRVKVSLYPGTDMQCFEYHS